MLFLKNANIGFSLKAAKGAGILGAGTGAVSGLIDPKEGQSRVESASKTGLKAGLIAGLLSGALIGQAVKKGDSVLEYLKKTMQII